MEKILKFGIKIDGNETTMETALGTIQKEFIEDSRDAMPETFGEWCGACYTLYDVALYLAMALIGMPVIAVLLLILKSGRYSYSIDSLPGILAAIVVVPLIIVIISFYKTKLHVRKLSEQIESWQHIETKTDLYDFKNWLGEIDSPLLERCIKRAKTKWKNLEDVCKLINNAKVLSYNKPSFVLDIIYEDKKTGDIITDCYVVKTRQNTKIDVSTLFYIDGELLFIEKYEA